MLYLFLFCLLIVGVYAAHILAYTYGWTKSATFSITSQSSIPFVTVVIALRNESVHLPTLMQSLKQQTHKNFEVLFVNDHSDDNSESVFSASYDGRFRWINSDEMGKKAALRQGIDQAKSAIILTTDADVILPSTWITSMVQAYQLSSAQLLIGPVTMCRATAFQMLDYFSIEGTTHGSAQMRNPILCSGANLAFSKSWYQQCVPYLQFQVPSGDDMFLLEATKRLKGKVVSINSLDATVLVEGSKTYREFLSQRTRWASKAPSYTDPGICFVGAVVALTQVACLVALVVGVWYPLLFLVFLLKFVSDALLIMAVASHHQQLKYMIYYPMVALCYPFYVIIVLISTLFPKKWKKRTY
jgi:glycosyltransferase involved in cell wall biosynthesis